MVALNDEVSLFGSLLKNVYYMLIINGAKCFTLQNKVLTLTLHLLSSTEPPLSEQGYDMTITVLWTIDKVFLLYC